jgi:CRP-like cAMP-binding protein
MYKLSSSTIEYFLQLWRHNHKLLELNSYNKNEVIFQKGEIVEHIYFVKSGNLRIYIDYPDKEANVSFYFPEDVIVPFNCIGRDSPAICTLRAMSQTELISIDKKQWLNLAEQNHFLFVEILKLSAQFSEHCIRHLADVDILNVKGRYETLFEKIGDYMYEIPDEYLASYIGTDRSNFNKVKNKYFERHNKK